MSTSIGNVRSPRANSQLSSVLANRVQPSFGNNTAESVDLSYHDLQDEYIKALSTINILNLEKDNLKYSLKIALEKKQNQQEGAPIQSNTPTREPTNFESKKPESEPSGMRHDLEKENRELCDMIADYKVKLFQAQRESENLKKKLDTASNENKTLKQELDLSPLKFQLDNMNVNFLISINDKKPNLDPRQSQQNSLIRYMTYIVQTVGSLDRSHFARSCFEERFPKDNSILDLFRSNSTDLILLKAFRYISDLLINIVSYSEFTKINHVRKFPSPTRSADKSVEMALDQLKLTMDRELSKNLTSNLSPSHVRAHSKMGVPSTSISGPIHQSYVLHNPNISQSDSRILDKRMPLNGSIQQQFGRMSPIQGLGQSGTYNQGEFLITDHSQDQVNNPEIKPFGFAQTPQQDKSRSPNQEQLRKMMANQVRPTSFATNSGQKTQISQSQSYIPLQRETLPNYINQQPHPSFRLNMEKANEVRRNDISSDSYGDNTKSLSIHSQFRESQAPAQNFQEIANQVYIKDHYVDDRVRSSQVQQQYMPGASRDSSFTQNEAATNSNGLTASNRRTPSIDEKTQQRSFVQTRGHQSMQISPKSDFKNYVRPSSPNFQKEMEQIQEIEQEARSSQMSMGGKQVSRPASFVQKGTSINSRQSNSATNTSRVSFGRTDPNPKNNTERPLHYIQDVPRKRRYDSEVYQTYDPIRGKDLRANQSLSPNVRTNPITGDRSPANQSNSIIGQTSNANP